MRCKMKAKKMEAEKMVLNQSNIPIVIFIKIQGLEVQVSVKYDEQIIYNFHRSISSTITANNQDRGEWGYAGHEDISFSCQ